MKCPVCGDDMREGSAEVTKTTLGRAFEFFFNEFGVGAPGRLAVKASGEDKEEIVLKEREKHKALLCPACHTFVLPGEKK